ncbi:zinc transporter ZntB [Sphingomonas abietis]|uniref:Zinc transporter ZntB n=1 Tax=Sphingomonas abietis TaxID=3012344 RepID=A0ABY7NJG8_9SPHN|nr:zinc transporter ZntB [Sphingomonas abietis]WBO21392.1 zinc transporter ZntB [Sphingomonas abietis]
MTHETSNADGPVIFAREIAADGTMRSLGWDHVRGWRPAQAGDLIWVHLDRNAAGVDAWLRHDLGLSPATVDAITSNQNRPRAFREGNALATILRGINSDDHDDPENMVAIQIWADASHVVTLRRRRLQAPKDVLAEIEANAGNAVTVGDLVTRLVEQTVSRIGGVVLDMNDRIDELERQCEQTVVEDVLTAIARIRRKCLSLKRHMSPQHEALIHIARDAPDWLTADNRAAIRETIDQLHHYLEDIDVSMESAIVLQDDLNNRATAQTNKTSYLLSIVAAIFLPLGFLTGLLGMNVGGLPGTSSHAAFWITCAGMAILAALQLFTFRKLKWL